MEKMKTPKGAKKSLRGCILRLLGKSSGFEQPFQPREEAHTGVSINYEEYKNAFMEAETKKAQALMQLERHRSTFH